MNNYVNGKHDIWIHRAVTIVLGSVVVLCVLSGVGLHAAGKTIPDLLNALGGAAIGALTAFFSGIMRNGGNGPTLTPPPTPIREPDIYPFHSTEMVEK